MEVGCEDAGCAACPCDVICCVATSCEFAKVLFVVSEVGFEGLESRREAKLGLFGRVEPFAVVAGALVIVLSKSPLALD